MPKELYIIDNFNLGIYCNGDVQDIPDNAAIMSVNVNPNTQGFLAAFPGPNNVGYNGVSGTAIVTPTAIEKIVIGEESNGSAILGYLLIDDIFMETIIKSANDINSDFNSLLTASNYSIYDHILQAPGQSGGSGNQPPVEPRPIGDR